MFERDYLMKLLADLCEAIARSMLQADKEQNPYAAARSLEVAIGNAVDMDAILFLSLEPESIATMLSLSSIDEDGTEYIARSLALASVYNRKAGDTALADLRMAQARAIADAYGHDLGEMNFESETSLEEANETMQGFLDSK